MINTSGIKAIETRYRGYRFRSRLEARWAVYFDVLGVVWDYEKEGFDLGAGLYYLPDFWLSAVAMWAEVKPEPLTELEIRKCRILEEQTGASCLFLVGTPDYRQYESAGGGKFLLSNYHDYPRGEGRFYSGPGRDIRSRRDYEEELGGCDDVDAAISASRSARFDGTDPEYRPSATQETGDEARVNTEVRPCFRAVHPGGGCTRPIGHKGDCACIYDESRPPERTSQSTQPNGNANGRGGQGSVKHT